MIYLTRAEVGLPLEATNSTGTLRPFVTTPAEFVTIHYTGNSTPLGTPTVEDAKRKLLALEKWARYVRQPPTPDEYNFVLFDVKGEAVVCEYAGFRRGAHSAGENDRAFGVLFYLGVGQPCPDSMVEGYRWLRDVHLAGRIDGETRQTPHRNMPAAATPCPGANVLVRFPDLLKPYQPPIPAPPTEEPVQIWRTADNLHYLLVSGWTAREFGDNLGVGLLQQSGVETVVVPKAAMDRLTIVEPKF